MAKLTPNKQNLIKTLKSDVELWGKFKRLIDFEGLWDAGINIGSFGNASSLQLKPQLMNFLDSIYNFWSAFPPDSEFKLWISAKDVLFNSQVALIPTIGAMCRNLVVLGRRVRILQELVEKQFTKRGQPLCDSLNFHYRGNNVAQQVGIQTSIITIVSAKDPNHLAAIDFLRDQCMINGIVYCDDEDAITTIANVLENLNGPERQLHLDLYDSDINIPVTERCGSTLPAPLDIKITDPKQPEVGITKLFASIATFNLFFGDNQIGADDGDSKMDEPGNERVKEEDSDSEMADHQPGNDNQRVEVEWQEKGLGEQDDEDEEDDVSADDSEMDEPGNKCVKEEDDDSEMADHQPGNDNEEFGGVNH
ncbi:hypothetical protein L211DRAFT_848970 [Terfezia boudieri ATCC MYA-4762]|uniref:Uncharacterized protein n=1 Tax=Terfezia boudieri ATCC MYA-4762 TaxID=1051890 RepID=A0A3N4LRQ8_9PEZI|nr:hypothetical protein L211DRAFT_848970 [Terfezia boudieri ATCC MYA-4762]